MILIPTRSTLIPYTTLFRSKLSEESIVTGDDDDRPRGRLERLERHDSVTAGAMALGNDAGGAERRVMPLQPREARLVERRVDDAASAAGRTSHQRRQNPDGRPHAGAVIEDRGADARGRTTLVTVHHHDPRERLEHRLVAGLEPHRSARAKRPHRAVDQPRKAGGQRVSAEAELVDRPRPQILEHDVGIADERREPFDGIAILEVDDDRALVGVDGKETGRRVLPERRPPAPRVVALRPLDL